MNELQYYLMVQDFIREMLFIRDCVFIYMIYKQISNMFKWGEKI